MIHKEELIKQKEKSGIAIPINAETEYAKSEGLYFTRTDDDMKIIGVHRIADDNNTSSTNIHFHTGFADDENGKYRLHHFVEHIVASRGFRDFAQKHLAYFNASTTNDTTRFDIEALYNSEYKDIGLIPMMEKIFANLHNLDEIERYFESEKRVLKEEYISWLGNASNLLYSRMNQAIYSPENPMYQDTKDELNCLDLIQKEDIEEVISKEYVKQNTTISLVGTGMNQETKELFDLSSTLTNYLPTGKALVVEFSKYELLNPDLFKHSDWQFIPMDAPTNLCNVNVVWFLDCEIDTIESTSLGGCVSFLNQQITNEIRENGLAYYSSIGISRHSYAKVMVSFGMQTENSDIKGKLEKVTTIFNDAYNLKNDLSILLSDYRKQNQLQTKILPVNKHAFLNYQLESLHYYNRLGNFKENLKMFHSVTDSDLLNALHKLDIAKAAKIVIGNF